MDEIKAIDISTLLGDAEDVELKPVSVEELIKEDDE